MKREPVAIRHLGMQAYPLVYEAMQTFTAERTPTTPDEIWFCEHPPVFTVGLRADPLVQGDLLIASSAAQRGLSEQAVNPLGPGDQPIPIIQTDRGGHITYHGPGQVMVYFLLNLRQRKQGPAQLVCLIEKTIIQCLGNWGITAHLRAGMPGVYVDDAKICALGLRIKNGCSYHGLALNVDMDLRPFDQIHPCGYQDLKVTQMTDHLATPPSMKAVVAQLEQCLLKAL